MKFEIVAEICAPHFTAGFVIDEKYIVIEAAPIIAYMKGWTRDQVRDYCKKKGWQASVISSRKL